MRLILLVVLLASITSSTTAAAQEEPAGSELSPYQQRLQESVRNLEAATPPDWVASGELDGESRRSYHQAQSAFYLNLKSGYEYRQRVLAWQLQSGRIIFVLVAVLVLVGVYFSWMQFRLALRDRSSEKPSSNTKLDSTIEASFSGLKIQSSVLGVIILALSLAFFYLYLVHVYTITEIR